MSMNFERWLRVPQLAFGYLSPLRRAALVGGAAFCASLAMTAASVPADAQPASAPVGVFSPESERLTVDEFSSRRGKRGGGGYGAGYASGGYGDRSFKSRGSGGRVTSGGYGDRSFKSRGYFSRHYGGRSYGSYTGFQPRAYW